MSTSSHTASTSPKPEKVMSLVREIKASKALTAQAIAEGRAFAEQGGSNTIQDLIRVGVALGLEYHVAKGVVLEGFAAGVQMASWGDCGGPSMKDLIDEISSTSDEKSK